MHTYGSSINILSQRWQQFGYGMWAVGCGPLEDAQRPFAAWPVRAQSLDGGSETLSQAKERAGAAAKSHFELLKHSERLYSRVLSQAPQATGVSKDM